MDVETMLVAIRGAFANDATTEARLAGTAACQAMLAALESQRQATAPAQLDAAALARAVSTLRGVPAEQLLDLAIAKLRSALSAGVEVGQAKALNFRFVPVSKGP